MTRRARARALLIASMAAAALAGCNLGLGGGSTAASGSTGSGTTGSAQKAIYSLGGSISLTASGLSLTATGAATLSVAAGASSFSFATPFAMGESYSVGVGTQPDGQTCAVSQGNGTVAQANVTSVQVSCAVNTYTIGGTISGLNAGGLVLMNGTATLGVALGSSAFVLPAKVALGATYAVTVQTQPTGLTCQVENGSGVMPAGAVTNLSVVCGSWVWSAGSSSAGAAGTYGSLGMGAPGNVPGAREPAAAWIDAGGHLWMFGGNAGGGMLNDLWMYTPGADEWTWVGGASSTNAAGIYGSPGSNVPGARVQASSWIDGSGALWLFGGQGYDANGAIGELNDLWKYDVGTGRWTWVSGADTAWASGSAAPVGEPGARTGAVSWIDGWGDLWLFGGSGTQGLLNDLWEYMPGSGQWTLVSGSQTAGAFGVYGTRGAAASTNVPGSRAQAAAAIDTAGNLWLFGGTGYGALGNPGPLNDLWEFTPSSGKWTWVSGWNTVGAPGVYGTSSTAAPVPGARYGAAAAMDGAGNLWLFGGTGDDAADKQGLLADLWEFDNGAGQWIWMGGPQGTGAAGSYGVLGVSSPTNSPGARAQGVAWIDGAGDFWLFGGQGADAGSGIGLLNDLWQFAP